MLVKEFKARFESELSEAFPQTEINSLFYLLIEHVLGLQRIDLVLDNRRSISLDKKQELQDALNRLKAQEPIQYIIQETEFYSLPFKVTKDTLIPRPETEELVAWILSDYKNTDPISILEIGTGSGCIPISIAKHLPQAKVSSIDISEKALEIAAKNAATNKVSIAFTLQDILTTETLSQSYDIIVSNPPYVRELEKVEIKPNVLDYEPHLALFVENSTPLKFYAKIANLARKYLKKNGALYFEINQYLGKETTEMLTKKGFTTVLRKDIFGNDRMTKSLLQQKQ